MLKLCESGDLRRQGTTQIEGSERQYSQFRQIIQLVRERAGQRVAPAEAQVIEAGKAANFGWYLTLEEIPAKGQASDLTVGIRADPVPLPQGRVGQPVVVVRPFRAVGGLVDGSENVVLRCRWAYPARSFVLPDPVQPFLELRVLGYAQPGVRVAQLIEFQRRERLGQPARHTAIAGYVQSREGRQLAQRIGQRARESVVGEIQTHQDRELHQRIRQLSRESVFAQIQTRYPAGGVDLDSMPFAQDRIAQPSARYRPPCDE